MSKQLTPRQWKNCFKKYESYNQSQFWNYDVKFKTNKTITQRQKQRFKNTYISYKKGNVNIICSMSKKKARKNEENKKAWFASF